MSVLRSPHTTSLLQLLSLNGGRKSWYLEYHEALEPYTSCGDNQKIGLQGLLKSMLAPARKAGTSDNLHCKREELHFQWSLVFSSFLKWLRTTWTSWSPKCNYAFLPPSLSSLKSWTIRGILSNKYFFLCRVEIAAQKFGSLLHYFIIVHRRTLTCSELYNNILTHFFHRQYLALMKKLTELGRFGQ